MEKLQSKSIERIKNSTFEMAIFYLFLNLIRVTIVKDKESRQSKGIAFVLYSQQESVDKAINDLNGKEVYFLNLINYLVSR